MNKIVIGSLNPTTSERSASQSQVKKTLKLTEMDINSQLNKFSSQIPTLQSLQFPIQLRKMTKEETKEYHLKKFAEWGKKWEEECKGELVFGVDGNIYRNGKLLAEEPNHGDKEWAIRKMKSPSSDWRSIT